MRTEDIINVISDILTNEIEMEKKDIECSNTLVEFGIDSITFMMLIVYIEDKLSIEIDMTDGLSDEYSKITFGTLIQAICKKME